MLVYVIIKFVASESYAWLTAIVQPLVYYTGTTLDLIGPYNLL